MWVKGRLTKKRVTTGPGHIWPEEWSRMSKHSRRKATIRWAEEKPTLDAAREQRGIYFIPDDPECEEIMNNSGRKLELRRASGMPCTSHHSSQPEWVKLGKTCASDWSKIQTKRLHSSCSKQDHEKIIIDWQRIRTTKRKETTHQGHIVDRGEVSMSLYNMVHRPISMLSAHVAMDKDGDK